MDNSLHLVFDQVALNTDLEAFAAAVKIAVTGSLKSKHVYLCYMLLYTYSS